MICTEKTSIAPLLKQKNYFLFNKIKHLLIQGLIRSPFTLDYKQLKNTSKTHINCQVIDLIRTKFVQINPVIFKWHIYNYF